MAEPIADNQNKLTNLQLEFLKSLKYLATEKQLADIKSLIRFYFSQKLDEAIEKTEKNKEYTALIYESWLTNNTGINPAGK
ncbi:MAG: hypothetical protein WDN26_14805 [Chitinophagaceae bacterium]